MLKQILVSVKVTDFITKIVIVIHTMPVLIRAVEHLGPVRLYPFRRLFSIECIIQVLLDCPSLRDLSSFRVSFSPLYVLSVVFIGYRDVNTCDFESYGRESCSWSMETGVIIRASEASRTLVPLPSTDSSGHAQGKYLAKSLHTSPTVPASYHHLSRIVASSLEWYIGK